MPKASSICDNETCLSVPHCTIQGGRASGRLIVLPPVLNHINKFNMSSALSLGQVCVKGGLKTREWKRRDGQKCKVGKCKTGKRGTKLQGWKTRDWKTRHQTAGVETRDWKTRDRNCRGGKHGNGVYGQPNVTVYVNVVQMRHT